MNKQRIQGGSHAPRVHAATELTAWQLWMLKWTSAHRAAAIMTAWSIRLGKPTARIVQIMKCNGLRPKASTVLHAVPDAELIAMHMPATQEGTSSLRGAEGVRLLADVLAPDAEAAHERRCDR